MKRPKPLKFDWNEANREKNWQKHKVDYREGEEVFFNKPIKFFDDEGHSLAEKRLVTYGVTNKGRKLTLIFTIRKQHIRIISARDQSRKERKIYEQL